MLIACKYQAERSRLCFPEPAGSINTSRMKPVLRGNSPALLISHDNRRGVKMNDSQISNLFTKGLSLTRSSLRNRIRRNAVIFILNGS